MVLRKTKTWHKHTVHPYSVITKPDTPQGSQQACRGDITHRISDLKA